MSSSSNSPCAACKFLRRKCTQECVFAPYFPPDQPQKFASVHKVFGASNVAKLLNELNAAQREDAVNSLAYEADERLRDPVYGCVGLISVLQHQLKQLQGELHNAKKELSQYIGPEAMAPIPQQMFMPQHYMGNPSTSNVMAHNMFPMMGVPSGQLMIREHPQLAHQQPAHQQPAHQQTAHQQTAQLHQHQLFEAQHLTPTVATRDQQDFFRNFDPQQQQQDIVRFNSGFDAGSSVTATGYNQLGGAAAVSPSLALGTYDNPYQIQPQAEHHHHQLQAQLLLQPQQQTQQTEQQHQRSGNEEGRSMGPSC